MILEINLMQDCQRYSPCTESGPQSPITWPAVLLVGLGLNQEAACDMPEEPHALHTAHGAGARSH